MPFTHYPYGMSSFGAPMIPAPWARPIGFGGAGNTTGSGVTAGPGSQVFFVNSAVKTASDAAVSNGTDPLRPFKTINFAVSRCIANNGDVVYVGPGHVETVAAAAALTVAIAGVSIIGIGNGVERPIVNYTTLTSATVTITAANTWIQNIRFQNSIDARVDGIVVSAANCTILDCVWDDDTAKGSLISVRTTSAANNLRMAACRANMTENTGTARTEFVRIVGGSDITFQDCRVCGIFTTGVYNNITTLSLNHGFDRCYFVNNHASGLAIAILTTSTGSIIDCVLANAGATRVITSAHILQFDIASAQTANNTTGVLVRT